MLVAPAAPGWDRYLGASPIISLLLVEASRSNSYPGGEEGSQASCRSILYQSAVRSGKGSPTLISHCL